MAGYLPEYRIHQDELNLNATALFLTDLYVFSTDFDPTPLFDFASSLLQQEQQEQTRTQSNIDDEDDDNNNGLLLSKLFNDMIEQMLDTDQICCLDRKYHWEKIRQAQVYRQEQTGVPLRVWLTLGGAQRSSGFGKLLDLQLEYQTKFRKQKTNNHNSNNNVETNDDNDVFGLFGQLLIRLCQVLDLTGIVLDDHDVQGMNQYVPRNMQRLMRITQYIQLIQGLATQLHNATNNNKNDNKNHLQLALTLRPGLWLPHRMYHAVDQIHVMAYDTHALNISGTCPTGHGSCCASSLGYNKWRCWNNKNNHQR